MRRRLGLMLGLAIVGCPARSPPPCPPAEVVAAIHASAFFFQHGSVPQGQAEIERARRGLSGVAPSPATAQLIEALSAISQLPDAADDARAVASEQVRVLLSYWSCLPASAHEALHRDLPPLPNAR